MTFKDFSYVKAGRICLKMRGTVSRLCAKTSGRVSKIGFNSSGLWCEELLIPYYKKSYRKKWF
jgi:hypothetical protein